MSRSARLSEKGTTPSLPGSRAGGLSSAKPSHCARTHGSVVDYGRKYDTAVACFMDDFEACIAHLRFPVTHRRAIRTTNLLEHLFVEERRRLRIIPNAFGERCRPEVTFGALIRAAERWRSVKVTEFERRQLTSVRKELDQEYETMVGLNTRPSKDASPVKISSSSVDLTIRHERGRSFYPILRRATNALSRRKHGFDSRRARQKSSAKSGD